MPTNLETVFPPEILLTVALCLDYEDLATLSLVSRRLHALAFPTYLSEVGVSGSRDGLLISTRSSKTFRAIRCAFFATSIEVLEFKFSSCQRPSIARQIREATHFLGKLSRVGKLTLNFEDLQIVHGTPVHIFRQGSTVSISDWASSLWGLFEVIRAKQWNDLRVFDGSGTCFGRLATVCVPGFILRSVPNEAIYLDSEPKPMLSTDLASNNSNFNPLDEKTSHFAIFAIPR